MYADLLICSCSSNCRWDCSFHYGSLVEEVDGHTAILYHRLQLDWLPMYVLLKISILLLSFFRLIFLAWRGGGV